MVQRSQRGTIYADGELGVGSDGIPDAREGSLPHRAHWTRRHADPRGIYFGKYEVGRGGKRGSLNAN